MSQPQYNKHLVIFDFDDTIIDGNSDAEVNSMHPRPIPDEITQIGITHNGSIDFKVALFASLQQLGVTIDQIKDKVINLPFVPGMKELLDYLHSLEDLELIILSGANTLFVRWYLDAMGINGVSQILSNFAEVKDGRLVVRCHHNQTWCHMCSKNLCKGRLLENLIQERTKSGVSHLSVVYFGDGKNDFCPTLKLSEHDVVFPRHGFPLHKLVMQNSSDVKAKLFSWKSGFEVIEIFKKKLFIH